jgi:hypothetical protein
MPIPNTARAEAYLKKINAASAVRFGASGSSHNLRRGAWEITGIDGVARYALSHETRALNNFSGAGFGSRRIPATA